MDESKDIDMKTMEIKTVAIPENKIRRGKIETLSPEGWSTLLPKIASFITPPDEKHEFATWNKYFRPRLTYNGFLYSTSLCCKFYRNMFMEISDKYQILFKQMEQGNKPVIEVKVEQNELLDVEMKHIDSKSTQPTIKSKSRKKQITKHPETLTDQGWAYLLPKIAGYITPPDEENKFATWNEHFKPQIHWNVARYSTKLCCTFYRDKPMETSDKYQILFKQLDPRKRKTRVPPTSNQKSDIEELPIKKQKLTRHNLEDLTEDHWKFCLPIIESYITPPESKDDVAKWNQAFKRSIHYHDGKIYSTSLLMQFYRTLETNYVDQRIQSLFKRFPFKPPPVKVIPSLNELTAKDWSILLIDLMTFIVPPQKEGDYTKWNEDTFRRTIPYKNYTFTTNVLMEYYRDLDLNFVDKKIQDVFKRFPPPINKYAESKPDYVIQKMSTINMPPLKPMTPLPLIELTEKDWKIILLKIDQHIIYSKEEGKCNVWKNVADKHRHIHHDGRQYMIRRLLYFYKHKELGEDSTLYTICDEDNCSSDEHMYEYTKDTLPWDIRASKLLQVMKAKCIIDKDKECWLWQGYTDPNGYGTLHIKGIDDSLVHRIAYRLEHGQYSLQKNEYIRHDHGPYGKCAGPNCMNTAHLLPRTPIDNSNDMIMTNTRAKGEKVGTSKITDEEAQEIKDSQDDRTIAQRARDFNVSYHTVYSIDNNTAFMHLPRNGVYITDKDLEPLSEMYDSRKARKEERKIVGFTKEEYEVAIKRINEQAISADCTRLIDSKEGETIEPCLLLPCHTSRQNSNIGDIRRPGYITIWEHHHNNDQLLQYHPKTSLIRHLCPPREDYICVEKSHVKRGTAKENAQDRLFWASGYKLTFSKVDEIRMKAANGALPKNLAIDYDVSVDAIYGVLSNRKWKIDN